MTTFTDRLGELIDNSGVSCNKIELALGFGQKSIGIWRNGKSKPSSEAIAKLARYFGVTTDYLLGMSDSPYPYVNSEDIVVFDEIGCVKAGFDGAIDEMPTGRRIEVPASMLRGHTKDEFMTLRVTGNSMYPMLLDGDTILCRRCSSVDSGSLAVVLYNGDEATVKKVIYKDGEDWLELIPINPEYPPKRIEGADLQNCRILGVAVNLIRKLL